MSTRRRVSVLAATTFVALAIGIWWLAWPEPLPPLPDPNGFDRLVSAAEQIQGASALAALGDPGSDIETLQSAVEGNRGVLDATRKALKLPAHVPFSQDLQAAVDYISDLRMLARLLIAEGRVAEYEDRIDDAAAAYFNAVQLGHACTRGAYLVHMLVGVAIESTGHDALLRLAPRLDASTAQQVSQQLATLEQRREPFAAVLAAERRWSRVTIPWHQQIMLSMSGQRKNLLQPAIDSGLAAHRRGQALSRLVILKIALHQFYMQQGRYPERLDRLSLPDLKEATTDPYTKTLLVYRLEGEAYQLYSVGPNKKDDDGHGMKAGVATQTTDDISAWPDEE